MMLHGREDRENEPDGKEEKGGADRERKERGEEDLLLLSLSPSSLPLFSLSLIVEKDA